MIRVKSCRGAAMGIPVNSIWGFAGWEKGQPYAGIGYPISLNAVLWLYRVYPNKLGDCPWWYTENLKRDISWEEIGD